MKLSDTIERVYFSAYFEFQTSISFFLSVTESQSWVHSAQPCYNFELFSHFYYSITQNIFQLCIYNLQILQRGHMSLHISNFRPLSLVSCQPHDLKVGFRAQKRAMHHNFETFLLLHNSKHTQAMSMKLLVTIVGLYVSTSTQFKSQTSSSFFLSAT